MIVEPVCTHKSLLNYNKFYSLSLDFFVIRFHHGQVRVTNQLSATHRHGHRRDRCHFRFRYIRSTVDGAISKQALVRIVCMTGSRGRRAVKVRVYIRIGRCSAGLRGNGFKDSNFLGGPGLKLSTWGCGMESVEQIGQKTTQLNTTKYYAFGYGKQRTFWRHRHRLEKIQFLRRSQRMRWIHFKWQWRRRD